MIIICEECGKKYRIDPQKIKGKSAGFNCKACQHRITVTRPEPKRNTRQADFADTGPGPTESIRSGIPTEPVKPDVKKAGAVIQAPKKNRFGLTEKMISLMLMVTLLPLFIFWGVTFKQTNDRIRNDSEKLLLQTSERLVSHIDEWVDKNLRILKASAELPAITSMEKLRQESVLKAIRKNYPWVYLVYTLNTNGQNVARSDGKHAQDYSDRQYFKEIMAGKAVAWQALIGKTSKKPALVIAVPVKAGDKIVGVLASAMGIDQISKRIITWQQGQTGLAFLTDTSGKVISHPIQTYVHEGKNLSHHPLIAAFKNRQKGLISFADDKGTPFLGHVRGTALGWILAVQAEEKEVFQILKKAQFFAYIYLGITIIIVICIAFIAGRTMTKPIKELTKAADRISVGELDVEIKIKRKDEIGDLAEAILRMQDSLRLSIERLRRRR